MIFASELPEWRHHHGIFFHHDIVWCCEHISLTKYVLSYLCSFIVYAKKIYIEKTSIARHLKPKYYIMKNTKFWYYDTFLYDQTSHIKRGEQ